MPNWLFDPLWEGPSRAGRNLANRIDPPTGEGGRLRGFLAGSMEGAGDVLSDMTSPLSIASTAVGMGGAKRGISGIRNLGRGMRRAEQAAAPVQNAADDAANLAEIYERIGPEFVPIGGEDMINALRKAGGGARQGGGYIGRSSRSLPVGGENLNIIDMIDRIRR